MRRVEQNSLSKGKKKKKNVGEVRKRKTKHDGRRGQGRAPVVVARVRASAREAPHQGGHA